MQILKWVTSLLKENAKRNEEQRHGEDGRTMTREQRPKIKNINFKKYLPLIGCWVVLALLMGWFVFVSNDLMSAEQVIGHQCEQFENDMQRWHYLTNHQLFPQ